MERAKSMMRALLRSSAQLRYVALMAIKRLSLPFNGALARRTRESQGLTLKALADRCEEAGLRIDHTTISRWENGVFGPTAPSLAVLAKALDVGTDDLCTEPDEEQS
jgi:hypothetical protein